MTTIWQLSPSDLTFLWSECPRCFYLKVAHKFTRPYSPMPAIFNRIDKLMKDFFQNKPTGEICGDLPDGVVRFGEKWVTSQPIVLPNHSTQCVLKGKFDTVVEFVDASFGVVDFKTSEAKPAHIPFYGHQLHAYAYALENPAPGKLSLSPISKLGLLVVEPTLMDKTADGKIAYIGKVTWLACPRDDQKFFAFLDQVLTLLEQSEPPQPSPNCVWCAYRESARQNRL